MQTNYRNLYVVVKSICAEKTSAVVSCHAQKVDALQSRELVAFNYVQEKDGNDVNSKIESGASKKMYEENNFMKKRDTLSNGHYITYDQKESLYKLSVWRKYNETLAGRFYNTVVVKYDRVFTVDITLIPNTLIPRMATTTFIDPVNKIPQSKENLNMNRKLVTLPVFDRLRRTSESETPKSPSVKRLRFDLRVYFASCARAEQYVPEDSNGPSPSELAKAIRERHSEMQKKKELENSE